MRSELSDTVMMRGGGQPKEEQKIPYAGEKQAISNQLELASMADDHMSVMNTSPIKSSRVASTRNTKAKARGDK